MGEEILLRYNQGATLLRCLSGLLQATPCQRPETGVCSFLQHHQNNRQVIHVKSSMGYAAANSRNEKTAGRQHDVERENQV